MTGACASVTFGICAAGGPAIVGTFAAGGASVGGLLGELADHSEAITRLASRGASNLRTLILSASLWLSTSESVPTTPTNPCGDKPPAEQTDCQRDNNRRGGDSTTVAPRENLPDLPNP